MDEASQDAEIASLKERLKALEARVRLTEKDINTLWTPWWKQLYMFVVDGWPIYRYAEANDRYWRPWHRRTN